jgi:hypothetical protein
MFVIVETGHDMNQFSFFGRLLSSVLYEFHLISYPIYEALVGCSTIPGLQSLLQLVVAGLVIKSSQQHITAISLHDMHLHHIKQGIQMTPGNTAETPYSSFAAVDYYNSALNTDKLMTIAADSSKSALYGVMMMTGSPGSLLPFPATPCLWKV